MLEDACAEKRRLNPAWSQRRNFGKLNRRDQCADHGRMSSMIVTARRNHCRRAVVLGAIRIGMDTLVQLWRSTQRERPEKRPRQKCRDKSARAII